MMNNTPADRNTDWLLVFVLWGLGLAAAMQFAKVSISLPQLATHYEIEEAKVALLILSVGIFGILFGAAAGEIVSIVGARFSLLAAGIIGISASILQAFLPPFEWMFAIRLFEGISHLLIVVSAPTAIIGASSAKHQSITMGLWATFFGVAYALAGFVGIPILDTLGLTGLYMLHAIIFLFLLFVYFIFGSRASQCGSVRDTRGLVSVWRGQFTVYWSSRKSAPAMAFFWHTLMFVALLTYLPSLASNDSEKIWLAAMLPLVSIAGSFSGGVIAQKFGRPFGLLGWSFISLSCLAVFTHLTIGGAFFPYVGCTLMFVSGIVQAASFAAIPQLNKRPSDQAQANGAMTQLGNLGASCGTPIFAACIAKFSMLAIPGLVVLMCAAAVLTVALFARAKSAHTVSL